MGAMASTLGNCWKSFEDLRLGWYLHRSFFLLNKMTYPPISALISGFSLAYGKSLLSKSCCLTVLGMKSNVYWQLLQTSLSVNRHYCPICRCHFGSSIFFVAKSLLKIYQHNRCIFRKLGKTFLKNLANNHVYRVLITY